LPLAFSATARTRPMPLVEPGMKMVFPEMFMLSVLIRWSRAVQRPVIGGSAVPG
jgi:hypothetical protein